MPSIRRERSGVTLVEVLVGVAVVGLMVALVLPAVQAAREAARWATCTNNLKQIGLGFHLYAAATGRFPGGEPGPWTVPVLAATGFHAIAELVPAGASDALATVTAGRATVGLFLCPSEPRIVYDDGQVAANVTANARILNLRPSEIADGLSGTAMATDAPGAHGLLWPAGPAADAGALEGSSHPARRPLLMADGGVRPARPDLPAAIRQALFSPAGGEILTDAP